MSDLKPGARLGCPACSTEVVVVRPPSRRGELACGGVPLVDVTADRGDDGHPGHDGRSVVGKRYTDEETQLEVLCSRSGDGALSYDGRALGVKSAKPLPSSD